MAKTRSTRRSISKLETADKKLRLCSKFRDKPEALALALKEAGKQCDYFFSYKPYLPHADFKLALSGWSGANSAAKKLANHLEKIGSDNATSRIKNAMKTASGEHSISPTVLIEFLRALAKQTSSTEDAGYVIGTIGVAGKHLTKPIKRKNALILSLAFTFDWILRTGNAPSRGDIIKTCQCWTEAVEYASATFSKCDEYAAIQLRRNNKGRLVYMGTPK